MIFFVSDTHFGHKNILRFYPDRVKRYGTDKIYEVDQAIIDEWNSRVMPGDTVYHLGDVTMRSSRYSLRYLTQLKGKLILVAGNHDRKNRKSACWKSVFDEIVDYKTINYMKQRIVLCHYPIESWDRMRYGTWHLHGHCHGSIPYDPRKNRVDVGIDGPFNEFPISFDEIREFFSKKGE